MHAAAGAPSRADYSNRLSDRIIYDGDAGTRFTNNTGKVLFQFIAALHNTCGVCLQYHLKISVAWPIPIHYNCRCIQRIVKPGQQAKHDFCNYRELLDGFDESQKTAAIGASNYRLLKSGLAKWDDIVTPNRVRDFCEVVARNNLTVNQMTSTASRSTRPRRHTAPSTPPNTNTSPVSGPSCSRN